MLKKRNSNIEMLRIISILMVVISHYTVHKGIDNSSLPIGINRYLLEIFSLGNIGVILFTMISGYFMIDGKKEGRIKKLLILYLQVLFYSLGVYLLFVLFGYEPFSLKELIKYMFPFIFGRYWFVNAYIILYLFSPYINMILNGLSRREYFSFLLLMMLLVSFLPTFTMMDFYGNEIVQFILFYSVGGYFKKYKDNLLSKKKNNILLLVISVMLLLSSVIVIDYLSVYYSFNIGSSIYLFNRYSFVAIMFSISLFSIFVNKKESYSKWVNLFSSLVFGIYLLSDHNVMRRFLWIDLLENAKYAVSNYFLLHFVISILIVVLGSAIVEYIRKNSLEKLTNYLISVNENKVIKLLKKFKLKPR